MADRLAKIFGTEEDKVNCPFYFKTTYKLISRLERADMETLALDCTISHL